MKNIIQTTEIIKKDDWQTLKSFTNARIALGSCGNAIPLAEFLQFKHAHANARDAVYTILNINELITGLQKLNLPFHILHSKAQNRSVYLQRPDYGRLLNEPSANQLMSENKSNYDICIILADGLSANAINLYALNLLSILIPALNSQNLQIAPLIIVEQGRVAISDEIGFLLNAKISLILLGERPGLSSPESMGAYLTFQPAIGLTDENRNCVSNIHKDGLSVIEASKKILYLIRESIKLKISGVTLKENSIQKSLNINSGNNIQ